MGLACGLAAGAAAAADGVGAFGAYWSPKDGSDGFGVGGRVGLKLAPSLDAEVRGTYFGSLGPAAVDLRVIPLEASLVLNLGDPDAPRAYVGAGAAYLWLDLDGAAADDEAGWQAFAGLRYPLRDKLQLFGEASYRQVVWTVQNDDLGNFSTDVDVDMSGPGLNLGLLYAW